MRRILPHTLAGSLIRVTIYSLVIAIGTYLRINHGALPLIPLFIVMASTVLFMLSVVDVFEHIKLKR